MGLAKLNVWATVTDNPWMLNDRDIWVTVFTHNDEPLVWAGKRYELIQGPHGHVELELPPGIYYVKASSLACTNQYTDAAVVQVGCGETACVTLMLPSLARCIRILAGALRLPAARELIRPELLGPAQELLTKIAESLPTPVRRFELAPAHMAETQKLILQAGKAEQKG